MPNCPECGAEMVERSGKYGQFWGCPTFPKCRGTRPLNSKPSFGKKNNPKKEFIPSAYQEAIFGFVKSGEGNAVVEAVAGSGKTTTIVEALKFTPIDTKVAFVAFNVAIARELADRAPDHVQVRTLHSLGLKNISDWLGTKPQVDDKKVWNILQSLLQTEEDWEMASPLSRAVSLTKATLTDPKDPIALEAMCDRYGIELNGYGPRMFQLIPQVLERCKRMTGVVDFDDMIWLPIALDIPCQKFDFLFVDECQDLNKTQIELVLRSVKEGGRVVAVGDRNQGIYGFRGADIHAIPNIISALEAETLPLSISYRCPQQIVELAQSLVPEIEAAEGAKSGSIDHIPMRQALGLMKDGDMVLCRTNAPLVEVAYSLIRSGQKAVMRGRDIGKGLIHIVKKMKAHSIMDFWIKLRAYEARETGKLLRMEKLNQLQSLQDKLETIMAIGEDAKTVDELVMKIETLFSDSIGGVVCSSVHRAKGLEADRIFIIRSDLMPHPMAQMPWELVQEKNLQYVAYTRSKDELIFVE